MKIIAYVLMPDNSVIKKKIINPTTKIKLRYKVNGATETFRYEFNKKHIFFIKRTFYMEKCIFLKHNQVKPLDVNFGAKDNTQEQINKFFETGLFSELVKSSKNNKAETSFKIIIGVVAIIGLVLIVVFG